MNIFKILILITSLSLLFVFSGCQSNNSEVTGTSDSGGTLPVFPEGSDPFAAVILPSSTNEVTTNSEIFDIDITIIDQTNNPFTTGNMKIVYPNDIRTGRDVGFFANSTVPLNPIGRVSFIYTAPSDLSADTSDIVFGFYHDSNPTEVETFTVTINPSNETNATVLTDYSLTTSSSGGDSVMELEDTEAVSFLLKNGDNLVPDAAVTSIAITSLNRFIGTLGDNLGKSGETRLDFNASSSVSSSVSINIETTKLSGIIPIEVEAVFTDVNGDLRTLTKIFNVIVLSGPPSAMSLSYAGTLQDIDNAKFIEKWILTVTDKYNNRVNTSPLVSMGMLAGFAQDSSGDATDSDANYLYFNPDNGGTLDPVNDNFTANAVFGDVDDGNDILVTFGDGYTYQASGKWDIIKSSNDSELLIEDDYEYDTETSGLGFAVGHNYRQNVCDPGAGEHVANVYPQDNNFIIDETGSLIINVEYEYYLVGKSTMLWVNLVGKDYSSNETIKIGEARKVTLRGQGLVGESFEYPEGFDGDVILSVLVANTVEWYYNAKFSYKIKATGTNTTATFIKTSRDTYMSCTENSGIAYVRVHISAPESAGTVKLVNLRIANEF